MNHFVRLGLCTALAGTFIAAGGACSKADEPVATSNTSVASAQATSPKAPTTTEKVTPKGSTVGDDEPGGETPTVPKSKSTVSIKKSGNEFAAQAVEAFRAKLGDFKALEMTIHVDNFNAQAQVQDPAKPANVDAYSFDGSSVDGPEPVKLTGDGDLEENLFAVGEVAWEKLPLMMDQARTEIGVLEGSDGVTHLIIQKNLPFDNDTVVNVYVDGGDRTGGGYVSFHADGTLKKVYGPS